MENLSLAYFSDLQVTCFHAVTSSSVKMEIMIERRKKSLSSYADIIQNKAAFYCVFAQFSYNRIVITTVVRKW